MQMNFIAEGKKCIEAELKAIKKLAERLDTSFEKACKALLQCQGKIIVIGMGKSGHIGHKMAATLASTGSPAFFVHPGEASHGDLGMISTNDIIIAISNSGETFEITQILPVIKRLGNTLISITSQPQSTLSQQSDINLDISCKDEACPLGLAPTSTTTATLVLGDAIAVALLVARGFKEEDFALSHPGGSLGKKLLLRISDVMATNHEIPGVTSETSIADAIIEISAKGLGLTTIVNDQNHLLGIFTDGDIRRAFGDKIDIQNTAISSVMTANPKTVRPDDLAAHALSLMETYRITSLVVIEKQQVVGVIHLHQLLQSGIA